MSRVRTVPPRIRRDRSRRQRHRAAVGVILLFATAGCQSARDPLSRTILGSLTRLQTSVTRFVGANVERAEHEVHLLGGHATGMLGSAQRRTGQSVDNVGRMAFGLRDEVAAAPRQLTGDVGTLVDSGRTRLARITDPLSMPAIAQEREHALPAARKAVRRIPAILDLDHVPWQTPVDHARMTQLEPTEPEPSWAERLLWRITL